MDSALPQTRMLAFRNVTSSARAMSLSWQSRHTRSTSDSCASGCIYKEGPVFPGATMTPSLAQQRSAFPMPTSRMTPQNPPCSGVLSARSTGFSRSFSGKSDPPGVTLHQSLRSDGLQRAKVRVSCGYRKGRPPIADAVAACARGFGVMWRAHSCALPQSAFRTRADLLQCSGAFSVGSGWFFRGLQLNTSVVAQRA